MTTESRVFVVDAFTIQQLPFTGNPSAVYISDVVRSKLYLIIIVEQIIKFIF